MHLDFGDLSAGGSSYQTNSSSNATRMFVLDDFAIDKIADTNTWKCGRFW